MKRKKSIIHKKTNGLIKYHLYFILLIFARTLQYLTLKHDQIKVFLSLLYLKIESSKVIFDE